MGGKKDIEEREEGLKGEGGVGKGEWARGYLQRKLYSYELKTLMLSLPEEFSAIPFQSNLSLIVGLVEANRNKSLAEV